MIFSLLSYALHVRRPHSRPYICMSPVRGCQILGLSLGRINSTRPSRDVCVREICIFFDLTHPSKIAKRVCDSFGISLTSFRLFLFFPNSFSPIFSYPGFFFCFFVSRRALSIWPLEKLSPLKPNALNAELCPMCGLAFMGLPCPGQIELAALSARAPSGQCVCQCCQFIRFPDRLAFY